MQLSVIIVNYNVKYFLEKCLNSVQKATAGLSIEIIIIDNASTDNSIEYLSSRFQDVKFIQNNENSGFGKANNQGLSLASGDNILFLNPDTIIAEDTLSLCVKFLEQNDAAGACGVRMVDGKGAFLPESKRGFPSILTSFYKLSGITARFPRSKSFARYYMGHLPEHENHEVDVLAGAFLMIKRKVLNSTGGFDEAFFMYGEDVDLSYRIQKAGWKNYYFPTTTIIHFKGESTKKGNLDYVHMFYKAMSIFVKKHYGMNRSGWFTFLIQVAIRLSAFSSAVKTLFKARPVLLLPGILETIIIVEDQHAEKLLALLSKTKPARNHQLYTRMPANNNLSNVNEIIFSETSFTFKEMIQTIEVLPRHLVFRFYDPATNVIIGSDSKNKSGIVIV